MSTIPESPRIQSLRYSVEMVETTTYDDMAKQRRTFIRGLVHAEAKVLAGTFETGGREEENWLPVHGYGVTKQAARGQLLELAGQMVAILTEPGDEPGA